MLPLCVDQGVGVLTYSPLARGLLAGNRTPSRDHQTLRGSSDPIGGDHAEGAEMGIVDEVARLAAERGVAPATVALAWLLHQPAVTAPVVGATTVAQIDDAGAALVLDLGDDERAGLEARYRPRAVVGHA